MAQNTPYLTGQHDSYIWKRSVQNPLIKFPKNHCQKSRCTMPNMGDYFTIEGIASTDSEDTYGEIIHQDGINLSFVEKQLVTINIEHGADSSIKEMSVVGVITDAEIRDEGLWIKGKIYREHQYAESIYRELSRPEGNLQFSVEMSSCVYGEGRFSNVILSGILVGVALTKNPANDDTYAKLIKSVSDQTLRQLVTEMRQLNKMIYSTSQRQLRKKKIIVKMIKVSNQSP